MGAFLDQIKEEKQGRDEPEAPAEPSPESRPDPFLNTFETERFNVDADVIDEMGDLVFIAIKLL